MVSIRFSNVYPAVCRYSGAGLGVAIALAAGLWSAPASLGPQLPPATNALSAGRAQAQASGTVSPEEIQQYASSVLSIEQLRTAALSQIQQFVDGAALQGLACHQSNTVRQLSAQAKEIFVQYCSESIDIVEASGLSIARFNEITVTQQGDAALANQVQQTLQQLQLATSPTRSPQPLTPQ